MCSSDLRIVEIQGNWSPIKILTLNGGYQLLYAKDIEAIESFQSGTVFARDRITKQSFELKPKDYFGLYGRSRHQLNVGTAPAIQARALYGIGETAAMNIPAEPYLSTSTFNLAIVD